MMTHMPARPDTRVVRGMGLMGSRVGASFFLVLHIAKHVGYVHNHTTESERLAR